MMLGFQMYFVIIIFESYPKTVQGKRGKGVNYVKVFNKRRIVEGGTLFNLFLSEKVLGR